MMEPNQSHGTPGDAALPLSLEARASACNAADWTSRVIRGEAIGAQVELPEWLASSYATLREQVMHPAYPCFFGTVAEKRGEMFYAFVNGKDTTDLAGSMETFARLAAMPDYRKNNIAVFFEPDAEPLSHDEYQRQFWRILQALHDVDPHAAADAYPDPSHEDWEFSYAGIEMFVVCALPSFATRHSRNLGPGMVLLFQPRAVFVDTITNKVIGREARNQVRQRLLKWDAVDPHPDLGFYGDPGNLEWKQYFLGDDNARAGDVCPFLSRKSRLARAAHDASANGPATHDDIVSRLVDHAYYRPHAIALRYLADGVADERALSYTQLLERVQRAAAGLREHAAPGERVMILLPSGLDYVVNFLACLYAGLVAVPAYAPQPQHAQHLERLRAMQADCSPRIAIVGAEQQVQWSALTSDSQDTACITLTPEQTQHAAPLAFERPQAEALAFLQYTSGSTSEPKGVMVSHANIAANEHAIHAGMSIDATRDVMLSWLPLYHDMGLIGGLMLPLYFGFELVLLDPQHFLEQPARWLRAISRYRATVSGGPNFAYQLCADRVRDKQFDGLDLSCWRVAFCGAEPIQAATLDAFARKASSAGLREGALYPCYGLAEATLFASGGVAGEGALAPLFEVNALAQGAGRKAESEDRAATPLVDCGRSTPDHSLRIVDPATGELLQDGRVGEIHLGGPSIAQGYWNKPAASAATFVPDAVDGTRWLRTGDLGFVNNGRLFVTGRVKDLIILRGRNVYPQDIERALAQVDGLRSGRIAAFAVRDANGAEAIGVAAELARAAQRDGAEQTVIDAIRRAVAAAIGEPVGAVLLLEAGALPRTSSGKLRRAACATGFADGSLACVTRYVHDANAELESHAQHTAATPFEGDALEERIAALWHALPSLRHVQRDDDFFASGGQSIVAGQLAAAINARFDTALPIAFVFEHPTIAAQAAALTRLGVAQLRDVAQRITQSADEADRLASVDLHEPAPLSAGQTSLYLLWQLDPQGTANSISASVRIGGKLDEAVFEAALGDIVQRHAILRTRFVETDGVPAQIVDDVRAAQWRREDFSSFDSGVRDARLYAFLGDLAAQPFDLAHDPLLRVALCRVSDDEHVVHLHVHHIVADAQSLALLLNEWCAAYDARADGVPSAALDSAPLQYAAYARGENDAAHRAALDTQLAWWRARLASPVAELALPLDRPRAAQRSDVGERVSLHVPAGLVKRLNALAQAARATPFMVQYAAWTALLHRYSGQREFRVGVPVAGRESAASRGALGYFVNTLALPVSISGRLTCSGWLDQTRAVLLDALANQQAPLARVVAALGGTRDGSHGGLFQTLFNYEGIDRAALAHSRHLRLRDIENLTRGAQFDLALNVAEQNGALELAFDYACDVFDESTIERLAAHYLEVLEQFADAGATPLAGLRLSRGTGQTALTAFAASAQAGASTFEPVWKAIAAQARTRPTAVAVKCDGNAIDYRSLERWSNQIARRLQREHAAPLADVRVGLCVSRSVALPCALLGILKAGAAFVPLDADYPAARLATMLDDAGIEIVLVDRASAERVGSLLDGRRILQVEDVSAEDAAPLVTAVHPEALAYVIYTSGSTGRPKGVAVSHAALGRHLSDFVRAYGIRDTDTQLQISTINFDVALHEMLPALMQGGRVLMRGAAQWDLATLNAALEDEHVSFARIPTAFWQQWLREPEKRRFESLRQITVGGEALPGDALAAWQRSPLASIRVDNLYGPTETTVACLHRATVAADAAYATAPIGVPFASRTLAVIDPDGGSLPQGGQGELCIGGTTLARGYLGRPALTAERFVPDPHGAPGSRVYRSGDLGRIGAEGEAHFLGRLDEQIKLRGFRIEPGEIEAALRSCDGVRDALAMARDDGGNGGNKRLVAYWVGELNTAAPAPGNTQDETAMLRVALEAKLPAHMIPSAFVRLDALPLMPNGKLDRAALPAAPVAPTASVAPRDARERIVLAVWRKVLQRDDLGVTDDFFEAGGDSILTLQVVARLRDAGYAVTPREVFDAPSVARLAALMREQTGSTRQWNERRAPLPLTAAQRHFFERHPQAPAHWNQAVWLDVPATLDAKLLHTALRALVERHDALRLRFVRDEAHAWHQQVQGAGEVRFEVVEAGDASAQEQTQADAAARLQRGFDLSHGPLFGAALVRRAASTSDRLLLAAHHLIVDAVSWRVLIAELGFACERLARGEAPFAERVSMPWSVWVDSARVSTPSALTNVNAHATEAASDIAWWRETLQASRPLWPAEALQGQRVCDARTLTTTLDAEATRVLLQGTAHALRTSVEDMLLAALALSCDGWGGVLVSMESHGRALHRDDVDVSQTVGWFTQRYPLWLKATDKATSNATDKADSAEARMATLRATKTLLRAAASHAAGWERAATALQSLSAPQVSFNYLGQFDGTPGAAGIALRPELVDDSTDPASALHYALDLNAMVVAGELRVQWRYAGGLLDDDSAQALADRFNASLRELIAHCAQAGPGATPEDFPLAGLDSAALARLALPFQNVADLYPATPVQQGLLFHALEGAAQGVYVNQKRLTLAGMLDGDALRTAWEAALARHEVLRVSFEWAHGGVPLQVVQRTLELDWQSHDWHAQGTGYDARLDAWLAADRARPFDLAHAPLWRLALFARPDGAHDLVWTTHHLLTDGWSAAQLLDEVLADYHTVRAGQRTALDTKPRDGAPAWRDYVAWLQGRHGDEAWWRAHLASDDTKPPALLLDSAPALLSSPSDADANADANANAHAAATPALRLHRVLDTSFTAQLAQTARSARVTVNTVLQAAWALLLARRADRSRAAFGVTVSGRGVAPEGIGRTVGLFINTLPLETDVPSAMEFGDWARALQGANAALREHEATPLARVQQWSGRSGDALFDSVLVFENYPVSAALRAGDAPLRIMAVDASERSHYPLTVTALVGDTLELGWTADAARLDRSTLDALAEGYVALLSQIVAARAQGPLRNFALPAPTAASTWAEPRTSFAFESVLARFAEQVRSRPDARALTCGTDQLTYGELDRWSDALAARLVAQGARAETRVGLCAQRGNALVAGVLGVLKAGAAYVPLDPDYPHERLSYLLADAGIQTVLADDDSAARHATLLRDLNVLSLLNSGTADRAANEVSPANQAAQPHPEQLAYIIYTSGSTGQPKGVGVTHGNVARLLDAAAQRHPVHADDVWTLFHSSAFDFSVWEMFGALCTGARLVVVPYWITRDTPAFHALLRNEQVSVLNQTPSAFGALMQHDLAPDVDATPLASLRLVIFGGEKLEPAALARWHRTRAPAGLQLVNMYGITETTVHVTTYLLNASDLGDTSAAKMGSHAQSPIGAPLPDLGLAVRNATGEMSAAGELCVGGAGVARGYVGRPSLTAERFVPDPLGAPGSRLYRSGDRARVLADGAFDYLGRDDAQVKLRGFRIELGEVRHALLADRDVSDAVALVRDDSAQLVAYVVGTPGATFDAAALRERLASRLPAHMVPHVLVALDALPLTGNGKLDRAALPAPVLTGERVDASSEAERSLLDIWRAVLGRDDLGVTDNFFEAGGDSILSLQIVARARQAGLKISTRQVFEHPTVAALVPLVQSAEPHAALAVTHEPLGLTPIQRAFFDQFPHGENHWNQSTLLAVRGELDETALRVALDTLIAAHDALRLRFFRSEGAWQQQVGEASACALQVFDWREHEAWQDALAQAGEHLQSTLDIAHGPLVRAGYFRLRGEGRLLIAVHHLAVDGVSWRVLLDELQSAYEQALARRTPTLPANLPWSAWVQRAIAHARRDEVGNEANWWRDALANAEMPHTASPSFAVPSRLPRMADTEAVTLELDEAATRRLLQSAPKAYRASVEEVLLAALAQALREWCDARGALVSLEGHGREALGDEELDLSRTVGWFTTRYPLWLDAHDDAHRALVDAKERRRAVPHNGLHWGLLNAHGSETVRATLAALPAPRISFNYLGQFDPSLDAASRWRFASEHAGWPVAADAPFTWALDINAKVARGKLAISWRFAGEQVAAPRVQALVDAFAARLDLLVAQCDRAAPQYTPSDFGSQIDQDDLDNLLESFDA
ncbi:non-ribosomal peptide synthetase [Paraburkholderia bryophila]|uniref:non-ribosomal peptide synthetase n=1 Tax=Burkholderiaceae TaxID=119060 RepID=UPI0018CDA6D3|nr:non-ribosomal peptide synthetase [Burkholderia sp. 9120]